MSVELADNLSYRGKKPNFDRDKFETLAAMRAYSIDMLDEGHVAYCTETGRRYMFKSSNLVSAITGKWRLQGDSELAQSTGQSTDNAMSQKAVTDELNKRPIASIVADFSPTETGLIVNIEGNSPTDAASQQLVTNISNDANVRAEESGQTIENVDETIVTVALRKTVQSLTPEEQAVVLSNLGLISTLASLMKRDGSNSIVDALIYAGGASTAYNDEKHVFEDTVNNVVKQRGNYVEFVGKASGTITKGDNVQFVTAQGSNIIVKRAVPAEINALPGLYLGVATESVINNAFVTILWIGDLKQFDTSTYTVGQLLYYDTQNDGFTTTEPVLPYASISVGAVTNVSATQGSIAIRPTFKTFKSSQISLHDSAALFSGNSVDKALQELATNNTYLVCSTVAGTAAKTVTNAGFALKTGSRFIIKMVEANTANSVTLNINDTGAKTLMYNGVAASSTNSWLANELIDVIYDGIAYISRTF